MAWLGHGSKIWARFTSFRGHPTYPSDQDTSASLLKPGPDPQTLADGVISLEVCKGVAESYICTLRMLKCCCSCNDTCRVDLIESPLPGSSLHVKACSSSSVVSCELGSIQPPHPSILSFDYLQG